MTSPTDVRIERDGAIAEVVFDRPNKLNALTLSMFHQIRDAFVELDRDESVRVIVVRAEGRMFTAGLDLVAAMGLLSSDGGSPAAKSRALYEVIKDLQDCINAIARCRQPIIAAVHDQCLGGGIDIITACDIRLCTADARFSVLETKVAIVADLGTLQRLTPVVGKGMAREMAFTGRKIAADRALRCGLVNDVFGDRDALLAGARALAAEIASNSPLAVQGTKRVMDYSDEHSVEEGLEFVAQWNTSFLHSNDLAEAISAFMEKRAGNFTGT